MNNLQWFLRTKAYPIRHSIDCHTRQVREWHKVHFDRSVRRQMRSGENDYAFVDQPPPTITAVNKLAAETYSKRLPQTIGGFWITAVRQHTLTIDKDRTPNRISIDRATGVPIPTDPLPLANDSRQRENNTVKEPNNPSVFSENAQKSENTPSIQPPTETKQLRQYIATPQVYIMDQIVKHIGKP